MKVSVLLQFLGMGLIWGASFLFIKVALGGVSFGQVAWARIVLGAITLAVILLVSRQRLPRSRAVWGHFAVLAVANCVLPFLLFAWAEQYVTSSLASIYNATTPIMTAIMVTAVFRVEKLGGSQLFGIGIGIIGVLVIIAPWQQQLAGDLWGQAAMLGATACYGFAFAYTRRFLHPLGLPGTTLAFGTIGLAAVFMIVLTPIVAWQPVSLDLPVVGSLILLGALGTGLAYVWSFNVMRAWGPTSTSTVTYITPVVGVLLGIVLLGEVITWNEPVGAALVLFGILFTQKRLRLPATGLSVRAG